ncbi:MAG: EF-hand domain-containing protein [Sphingomonadales bacterium]|nr:EF-hand domain-containing protein [Sphingomonadales bacterium]MDE2170446.1 EF-hand domain-containing protein [Sphingomonadales bacterium]
MKHQFAAFALLLPFAAPLAAQGLRDPAAMFDEADANHDGRISRAEFQAARLARFARMDRNGDGVISREDFTRLIAFRPQAASRIEAMIAEGDLNHDGKVTREEMAHAPMRVFDMADANHDGYVDQAELAAARTRLRTMARGD